MKMTYQHFKKLKEKETVQSYMLNKSVEQCRMAFRIRCEMVDEVKGNFQTSRLGSKPYRVVLG